MIHQIPWRWQQQGTQPLQEAVYGNAEAQNLYVWAMSRNVFIEKETGEDSFRDDKSVGGKGRLTEN